MNPTTILAALAALVAAVAALIKILGGAFETRFADLRKEIAQLRDELETERRLRVAAQTAARSAEERAELAEGQVAALIEVNQAMRKEIATLRETVELTRSALVGSEAERNEAQRELSRRADDEARKRAAKTTEDTAPHKAQKT